MDLEIVEAGPVRVAGRATSWVAMEVGEPSIFPVLPNDAEALVQLGELDQAEELLDELEP